MLVKRNPILPNIFDELLRDLSIESNQISKFRTPAVNIIETEKYFIVSLAAPGLTKKDFNIDIEDNILTISTQKNIEKDEKKEIFILKEYNFDTFKRSFNLPKDVVDIDKVSATYKNGELIISISKQEIIKETAKLIEVK